ncbi:MAG: tyrosine--tRNA ligase [Deltaproteobacteria bacterium]|nr:tyrosine--tRNA ligase [Deltaproteobacteria bacterium]
MTGFISILKARGLFQDCSDEDGLSKLPAGTPFYVGFDPTAPSLQLGNLVPLIVTVHLAKAGMQPIILFGGATGAIGDPSGKNAERQLLPREVIDDNIRRHQATVEAILGRLSLKAQFVNNYDWTKELSVLDFLRETGKHFTVNYMIAKEVVKTRLQGEGISYTEFSYMLLQAYDFLRLYQDRGCRVQIGGSDQWGNITAGLELIRKKIQGEAFAFSIPLITDSEGKKFGKTAAGAVWLDPAMTSPYRFHQFWMNVPDADVIKYLRIFSFYSDSEVAELQNAMTASPEKREAQRALADSVCTLVHGPDATRDAKRCAEVLFGGSLSGLSPQQLEEIFQESPSSSISATKLQQLSYVDLLLASGLVKSKGDARRLIQSGGAYLNNERVSKLELQMSEAVGGSQEIIILRSGKKNYHLVRISGD